MSWVVRSPPWQGADISVWIGHGTVDDDPTNHIWVSAIEDARRFPDSADAVAAVLAYDARWDTFDTGLLVEPAPSADR